MQSDLASTEDLRTELRPLVWLMRIAWIALVGWACVRGYLAHPSHDAVEVTRWINTDITRTEQLVRRLIFEWSVDIASFVATGTLSFVTLSTMLRRWSAQARLAVIVVVGIAVCGLVRGVELVRFPAPGHLLVPLCAYLLGAAIGRACLRGPRALAWLLGQMAAFLILMGIAVVAVGWFALQDRPLPIEMIDVAMGDKHRVANTLRGDRIGTERARRVRLDERDINTLVAAVLPRVSPASRARVALDGELASAELALALRVRGREKFANIKLRGTASIVAGELSVRSDRLSIGRLAVPAWLLKLSSPAVATTIRHDRDLRNMVSSVKSMRLDGSVVETVFQPGECSNTFVPALAQAITGKPNLAAPTREHVRHLVEGATDFPSSDDRFAELLRRAFAFARARSVDRDPLIENQSALLALAILLGHPRVETAVGRVLDDNLREQAGSRLEGVTLRGRRDWTKHFLVSAALTVIACEGSSHKIGLLKEILDANEGGSGFSFGDLAANRAGILLAQVATDNLDSARAVQDRLAVEFPIDAVFPEADDLPENLTAAELQSRFGGVDGVEYRRLLAEIDRRLSECAALK